MSNQERTLQITVARPWYLQWWMMVLYAVAIVLTAYFLVQAFRSKATDELEAVDNALHEGYRCPNPDCHRFLGYTKYDELLQNGTCPYCRAQFHE